MKTKLPNRIALLAAAVLCFFSFCDSTKAYGQDFQNLLNNNAEWYYEIKPFIGCLPCVVGFQHIKAVRDTLINNQVCVMLEKSNSGDIDICDNMGTALEYLYADEQKVYWYNEHLDDFTILYDFAAETGGSWEIQVLDCTLLVTVDSTSTIILNSQERKILYISDENNFFTGGVIEGIGHTRNLFPSDFFYNCQGVACDSDFIDGLRCYLENEVILYKPAIADCDEVYPEENFEAVLSDDSISWDVAKKELFGLHMFKLTVHKHPDSIFTELISNIFFSPEEPMGKIREELNTGRLWYKRPSHNTEILIMDMTLALGDTFEIDAGHWVMVDSVFYLDNRKVIRFDMDSGWYEKIMFIEGVGPNISIIYRYDGYSTFYASCKYQDNELIYVNDNNTYFEGCQPSTIGINTPFIENLFKIFPNPCKDYFIVDINTALNNESALFIFNTNGHLLRKIHLFGFHNRISIGDLKKGVYFIKITNGYHVFSEILQIF